MSDEPYLEPHVRFLRMLGDGDILEIIRKAERSSDPVAVEVVAACRAELVRRLGQDCEGR